ncbi:MAG: Dam family site-specific DNA-(adenine-N6)-methyltransferase, partial [Bacteroidales bacterium]
NYGIQSVRLYDINDELVLTYKVVQKDIDKLLEFLYRYKTAYLSLPYDKRKEYYYEMRTNYNLQRFNTDYKKYSENWIPRAAQVIFLNKTCYNGLFRVNSKGEFNSPAGYYKNPKIFDHENIVNASRLLSYSEIIKADFKDFRPENLEDSFIYFDPPYRPISPTAYFTSYAKDEFTDTDQYKLANLFKDLDKRGAKLMLSNSDPKNIDPGDNFFDKLYKDYYIQRIPARRMVNAVVAGRGEINELIITNYKVA